MTHALAAAVEMRKGATDAVEASKQRTLALVSKWKKERARNWRWSVHGEQILFAPDIPEERIPCPERTRFRAGFYHPVRHHLTNYIMRPVRIRRGLPMYFGLQWLTRNYCEYHHLRQCQTDKFFKKHGIKRRPDGQLYKEDQPPQPPPEADWDKLTALDVLAFSAPPSPPPSPQALELDVILDIDGE